MDFTVDTQQENWVWVISGKKNFMITTMEQKCKAKGLRVTWIAPDVAELQQRQEIPVAILCYLEEDAIEMEDTLTYLKDYVDERENGVLLYLVGTPEELDQAHQIFPISLEAGVWERPLHLQSFLQQMLEDLGKDTEEQEKPSILVVDDDSTMLRMLKIWLSERYQVFMANSGTNAIAFLGKRRVDLVLLDYEMPVISGQKVLEMIRSEAAFSDIPVMFLTGNDDKESVMSVMDLKPEAYLLKNQPPEELQQAIDGFFEMRKGNV